jgi:hypothetical protein
MTDGETTPSRFRFSIGSLFVAVTVIGGFLGLLRLKWRLLNSDGFMQSLVDWVAFLPLSEVTLLLVSQIVALVVAAIALGVYREPRVLWLYIVGHLVWFAILLIGFLTQKISFTNWIGEPMLAILFFEPAFATVVAIVAWCISLGQRKRRQVMILSALLMLSLLADLFAQLTWHSFAGALAAAIVYGR